MNENKSLTTAFFNEFVLFFKESIVFTIEIKQINSLFPIIEVKNLMYIEYSFFLYLQYIRY